jgi:hypothetical protein
MRPLTEIDSDGRNKVRKNIYFTNYTLSIGSELDAIKTISIIESKIKRIKNQNALSYGNNIRKILRTSGGGCASTETSSYEDDELDDEDREMRSMGYDSDLEDDTYLSMYFGKSNQIKLHRLRLFQFDSLLNFLDIIVLSSFSLAKISIKPIEQQV